MERVLTPNAGAKALLEEILSFVRYKQLVVSESGSESSLPTMKAARCNKQLIEAIEPAEAGLGVEARIAEEFVHALARSETDE